MTVTILSLVLQFSMLYNVDPHLVMAVIETESNFNVQAVGAKGEVGLMQLMPSSFPQFKKKDLFKPELNIALGIKHLADMKTECKHKLDKTFIVCYNLGAPKGNKIKHPKLFAYYKKVYPKYVHYKKTWGLSMFQVGQTVYVLNAHVGGATEKAVVTKAFQCDPEHVGKVCVIMLDMKLWFEADRLLTEQQYYNLYNAEREEYKKRLLASGGYDGNGSR
jgi:hypothetical protein